MTKNITEPQGKILSSPEKQHDPILICHMIINKEESISALHKYFHFRIQEAAEKIGVCTTLLKKACRAADIERWPYRKILAITKWANNQLDKINAETQGKEKEIQDINEQKENYFKMIYENPNISLNQILPKHKRKKAQSQEIAPKRISHDFESPEPKKFIASTPSGTFAEEADIPEIQSPECRNDKSNNFSSIAIKRYEFFSRIKFNYTLYVFNELPKNISYKYAESFIYSQGEVFFFHAAPKPGISKVEIKDINLIRDFIGSKPECELNLNEVRQLITLNGGFNPSVPFQGELHNPMDEDEELSISFIA